MAFSGWQKVAIDLPDGRRATAVAPVVVSASRRTDIPAFHGQWFVNRLRAGYLRWTSPFGGAPQYVSFEKTRAVVFWTKNPRPLLPLLTELDERGIGYYFQFTLNHYPAEGLEPGVPGLAERIRTFRELSQAIGPDRVVWRYDPLVLTNTLDVNRLADRVAGVAEQLRGSTRKLVIAFVDIDCYAKVRRSLAASVPSSREFTQEEMRRFAELLAPMVGPLEMRVATCAEAIDLGDLGVDHNKCIDDDLLARLFPHDQDLMRFLGRDAGAPPRLKDKGQRPECRCIVSKDIGAYDTCPHGCRYCYANSSAAPGAAAAGHDPESDSLA